MSDEKTEKAIVKTKKADAVKVKEAVKAKEEKIIIDAEGCTLGRLCAFSAKKALNGKSVLIFNAEKAIISGKQDSLFTDYKRRYDAKSKANPERWGPHRPKNPDRFVRRTIRGMLPWGKSRGQDAFKRIMVYIGKPEKEIRRREHIEISKAKLEDNKSFKSHYDYFITVGELCGYLGGRHD